VAAVKALPLWQPWATLVAVGAKRGETRSWAPPDSLVGQRIAIHACRTTRALELCVVWPFNRYIVDWTTLPLGAVVATCVLEKYVQITSANSAALEDSKPEEFAFGDYTPGRFAWILRDVHRLLEPVPYRGSQGIFEIPDELVGHTPAQEALAL
jgi:hypothetical protein